MKFLFINAHFVVEAWDDGGPSVNAQLMNIIMQLGIASSPIIYTTVKGRENSL